MCFRNQFMCRCILNINTLIQKTQTKPANNDVYMRVSCRWDQVKCERFFSFRFSPREPVSSWTSQLTSRPRPLPPQGPCSGFRRDSLLPRHYFDHFTPVPLNSPPLFLHTLQPKDLYLIFHTQFILTQRENRTIKRYSPIMD